jgi:putative nucleotidyltransferase with HDIG domain
LTKEFHITRIKPAILTREECFSLMEQQGMLPNIVRHSVMVEKVAVGIAKALNKAGHDVDLSELSAAALLHDITKTKSIQTHENHAISGEQFLKALGYPRIGEIVGRHIELPIAVANGPLSSEEIVNYADKRVLHEDIVTLEERFEDLIARYGLTAEHAHRLKILKRQSCRIEQRIFSAIDREPEALPLLIKEP